jgi:hypothetical protein
MSYTGLAPAVAAGAQILRGSTLAAMARSVGVIGAAGGLAAVYTVATDEVRTGLTNLRMRRQIRKQRNEQLQMAIMATQLPRNMQDRILLSRHAYQACLDEITDPVTTEAERETLRKAILACMTSS